MPLIFDDFSETLLSQLPDAARAEVRREMTRLATPHLQQFRRASAAARTGTKFPPIRYRTVTGGYHLVYDVDSSEQTVRVVAVVSPTL
jgi:hypothetical protein